ncbi:lipase family protein [Nocardia seriolae]|uniref:Triacylglycerol lipase n=1 Tax=Nocardia seriolae TaxID=37332 RepID=A0ABC8AUY4_9NOCA|nr:lipase family protein [Nocardia seriolae]APA98004.1 Triacylglycerol lipase [Nocardia seriolae]QUN16427.1 hypothetical protein KEC46_29950 [Nocardia seriolae]WKY50024.1 lipase family protein [Nocardia seriolae]WNJ56514.1 lipase family protein [Nocardia seriolae]BEK87502.1 hypothetical protein NSERKGN1266_34530 [Nocardia seriolae]
MPRFRPANELSNGARLIAAGKTGECHDPGVRIHYVRDHFSEHVTLEIIGMPRVLLWMKDRFDGVPVESGCDIHDEGSMPLDPATWPVWLQGAGTLLAGILQFPIGSR